MKKLFSFLIISFALIWSGCGSVPITGRKQMLLVSNQEVLSLSLQQYSDFIKDAPISTDQVNTNLVVKVGTRIANAVETYLSQNGYGDQLADYSWEFRLVRSSDVNAFCMPGGKIVVYEGILPYTRDETGLAVVLGHEVAHAVAKHANERMSTQVATQLGGSALSMAMDKQSAMTKSIATAVYGLGSQYGVMLPYSRKQELEADELGLIFMAMAGYDPRQAADFWVRMSQNGGATPEFMSTHPSDQRRVDEIQKNLEKALKYYKGAGVSTPSSSKTSSQWKF